jgi:hypothetical protein
MPAVLQFEIGGIGAQPAGERWTSIAPELDRVPERKCYDEVRYRMAEGEARKARRTDGLGATFH